MYRLQDIGIEPITISYYDHHLCHAASAYYTSGFEKALVVTADGARDGLSGTIYEVRSGKWRKLTEIQMPVSVGHMYSWITRYAGFKISRHEGKITGLAAFGNPQNLPQLKGKLACFDGKRAPHRTQLVGLFQGKMEYGPRALGHRSILIHPGDKSINTIVNQRLRRTEFMPFAPVCLKEHADDLFHNWTNSRKASEFMTITYHVKNKWLKPLEAVVHIDGTARPQVISPEIDERFWKILQAFYRKTGLPTFVNTSFNMHEEPIVCTPSEALRSYLAASVDVLVLGDCIVAKTEAELKDVMGTELVGIGKLE